MMDKFSIYKQLTTRQKANIWKNGIIVLDSSALIDFYRFPKTTRDVYFQILDKISARVWIPYQVAHEFYSNRLEVIYDQQDAYDKICSLLAKSIDAFDKEFAKSDFRHPYIDAVKIKQEVEEFIESKKKEFSDKKKTHPKWLTNDDILKEIEKIFDKKVGESFSEEDLNKSYSEGESRYKQEIPPGYKDKDKKFPRQYGDYIIWKQILNKSELEKKPVIFITSDVKEDWWLKINGKIVGPRIELEEEFFRTTGKRFYLYQTLNFIDFASGKLNIDIGKKEKTEIEAIKKFRDSIQQEIEKKLSEQLVGFMELQTNQDASVSQSSSLSNIVQSALPLASMSPSASVSTPKLKKRKQHKVKK